jgi:hypothetical protein
MTICSYCKRPATHTIVANPHRVCQEHAVEFWTGLLDYTQGRAGACVKETMQCACAACEELAESQVRAFAISGARPSPGDHENFGMRLAS